jgi:hypothetical protein
MRLHWTLLLMLLAALVWALPAPGAATAADAGNHKIAQGLSVYLGVLPAALVGRGDMEDHPEAEMHDGAPGGGHDQHVMVAVFDAATGERVEDAIVEARVTPLGLAGVRRVLDPMVIADTITYGNYFTMRGDGPYRIAVSVMPAGAPRPVVLEFSYDHRTR